MSPVCLGVMPRKTGLSHSNSITLKGLWSVFIALLLGLAIKKQSASLAPVTVSIKTVRLALRSQLLWIVQQASQIGIYEHVSIKQLFVMLLCIQGHLYSALRRTI